jgi:regulator of sirC expression with transglutaminase-like and TPR domain
VDDDVPVMIASLLNRNTALNRDTTLNRDTAERRYRRALDLTDRFAELLARPEPGVPLDEAALLIAAHAHPGLDIDARLAQLDAMATAAAGLSATELATWLFVTEGFAGNDADYGDPRNSYLDDVLDRRLGIPITLSVLMMELGRRCGLPMHGVGMPGHFLVGGGAGEWFDPFHRGERLDLAGCAALFAETHPGTPFRPQFLMPVGNRRIVERMLANLQHTLMQCDPRSVVWVTRLRLRIPGITLSQRGDLAGLLGRLGHFAEAAREFDVLARLLPGEGAEQAASAAARFRARAN